MYKDEDLSRTYWFLFLLFVFVVLASYTYFLMISYTQGVGPFLSRLISFCILVLFAYALKLLMFFASLKNAIVDYEGLFWICWFSLVLFVFVSLALYARNVEDFLIGFISFCVVVFFPYGLKLLMFCADSKNAIVYYLLSSFVGMITGCSFGIIVATVCYFLLLFFFGSVELAFFILGWLFLPAGIFGGGSIGLQTGLQFGKYLNTLYKKKD